ncbi:MAG TPA: hypothetical protein VLX91_08325 [Candidatus Acidoferrales bacterium]|nr:hypothetical protein [Candidatus Acidoferrales bacterium]
MKRICPECLCLNELEPDSPATEVQRFLQSIGITRMKRCCNCNAAVLAIVGSFLITSRGLNLLIHKSYLVSVVTMVLVVGYVLVQFMSR